MEIALIGYGKMGKAIEVAARSRGHNIVLKIARDNQSAFSESNLRMADVAIEFTAPESAYANVVQCIDAGIPVVCGSTGWNEQQQEATAYCQQERGSLVLSSNFSIGVNLFFEISNSVASLMKDWPQYQVAVSETHHLQKKDAPSGTAITLAEQLLANLPGKTRWQDCSANNIDSDPATIPVYAHRVDEVPGVHKVSYTSDIDTIEITHTAHSREGFALGAVLAAEFIKDHSGVYSMKEVLRHYVHQAI